MNGAARRLVEIQRWPCVSWWAGAGGAERLRLMH